MIPRRSLLIFAAVASCAALLGAPFAVAKPQPAPDWAVAAAKTPTPANVKDAVQVILLKEDLITVDDQNHGVRRKRFVARILQPQGRRLYSYCGIGYDVDEKLDYMRSWTITPDGHQLQAMESDFTDLGTYDAAILQYTQRVREVRLLAADPGSVIVCESEEHFRPYMNEMEWDIQDSSPVVDEALELDFPSGDHYAAAWSRFSPVKPVETAPNHIRWEIRNVPALDLENLHNTPAWEALSARMSVKWGDLAAEGKDNQWRAIGQWFTTLEANRPDPSPEIIAQTQSLIAGAPDFYTKLSRITEYIQKNIRYATVERGLGGLQAHHAADIYRNGFGDCKDKTTLLISMLQVAGIRAVYMPVDSRRGVVDPDEPSSVGDHMITAIEIPADVQDPRLQAIVKANDGKRYLIFDPTDERTPVGNLPSDEQGGYGTLAAGADSQVIAIPILAPDANVTERKGSFTLSADGTLTGSVDASHTGPGGADLRSMLKYTDDKERREYWEHNIALTLPGVTLDSFSFTEPSDLDKPIVFHYKVTVHQYSHQAGTLLLVRPRVISSDAIHCDDTPRIYPIDLGATGRWHTSFDISIPPGYIVDETPDPVHLDAGFASYRSTVSVNGNLLHFDNEYVVRQVEIPASKAADFRQFESAIIEDEKGEAVLRKK